MFTIQIRSLDNKYKVGVISRNWSGLGQELFTDSTKFGIQFPVDLDVRMKAVLLGACILIVSNIFLIIVIAISKSTIKDQ